MDASTTAPSGRPLRPAAAQAQEMMRANPGGIDLTLNQEFVLRPARKAPSAKAPTKRTGPAKTKAKGKAAAKPRPKVKVEKTDVNTEAEGPAQAADANAKGGAQAADGGGGAGGMLIKTEQAQQQAQAEGDRVSWDDEMIQIFFNVANRDKFKEKLRSSAGFGYKTHQECYDTIAAEIKKPEVDGEKCAKKMENMLTAMKRYHEKKRQSGTSGDKVRRAKAGQGVVELEELLRKDRPRFDPASLLDSSAEPRAAAAEADGDDDAAEMDHAPLGGEEAEAKDPDEKEGKEGKSERKEGKGKDKAKPDKVDPHAQAPDPRPPGVSRKKRKAKADADKGPPPKSPRKNSVKAATEALISRLDDKDKERAEVREKERAEETKLRQAEVEAQKESAASIRLLAAAIDKANKPAPAAAAAAVPAGPPAAAPLSAQAIAAALRQLSPEERQMLKNSL